MSRRRLCRLVQRRRHQRDSRPKPLRLFEGRGNAAVLCRARNPLERFEHARHIFLFAKPPGLVGKPVARIVVRLVDGRRDHVRELAKGFF